MFVCVRERETNTSVCVSCHFSLALFSFFSVACLFSIEKEKESVVDLVWVRRWGGVGGRETMTRINCVGKKKLLSVEKEKK